MRVQAAYDTRKGNPLSRYSAEDFQLGQLPIQIQENGVDILGVTRNEMTFRVVEPESFRLAVTGFDENRQVYVRAVAVEDDSGANTSI